jgi:ANTAR domain
VAVPVIRVEGSAREHAESLGVALTAFRPRLVQDAGAWQVEIMPHEETARLVLALFDAVGSWLLDAGLASCQLHIGERSFTLLQPSGMRPTDSAAFLLERVLQLQSALDSRVVIEQAKGILAERFGLTPDRAFELLRNAARSNRISIQHLAGAVVERDRTPAEIAAALS